MTRKLLTGLLLLSLTACGLVKPTPPPSTDLQILRAGVKQLTSPRTIAGPFQDRSQLHTNGDLWLFAGSAQDAAQLSELDKARVAKFVDDVTAIIEKARLGDCGWLDFACRKRKREPVK